MKKETAWNIGLGGNANHWAGECVLDVHFQFHSHLSPISMIPCLLVDIILRVEYSIASLSHSHPLSQNSTAYSPPQP
jgi:hypothetical protein